MAIVFKSELTPEQASALDALQNGEVAVQDIWPGRVFATDGDSVLPETIGKASLQILANMVKKMEASGRKLSEREHFMLEAATQHGFEYIDDNTNVLAVDAESLVDFMSKWKSPDERTIDALGINEWIDRAVFEHSDEHIAPGRNVMAEHTAEIAREAVLRVVFDKAALITNLANDVHQANVMAGWWNDLKSGEDLHGKRNVGELLCLMHSELSEAMEGHRKGLMDDKLPHRPMFRVELIDCLIRILDTLGAEQNRPHEHPAGVIFCEKRNYNNTRADHKPENRLTQHGKRF